jgi:hypothetical protein
VKLHRTLNFCCPAAVNRHVPVWLGIGSGIGGVLPDIDGTHTMTNVPFVSSQLPPTAEPPATSTPRTPHKSLKQRTLERRQKNLADRLKNKTEPGTPQGTGK